eukprot:88327-Rhodomonas_salina.2
MKVGYSTTITVYGSVLYRLQAVVPAHATVPYLYAKQRQYLHLYVLPELVAHHQFEALVAPYPRLSTATAISYA